MSFSVKDIAKTLKDNKKQGLPVIIFTGAGCSKSAGMPLANELVAEINKKFKSNLRALTDTQKKDYGSCMGKLTPHEQKTLIEKHISKAKINWAHIALASLLKEGYIGKVLTFNFDNILNRACSLDNFFPPTYDLKVLSEEYFSAIPNQSIVHLHGQWSGFQLANSDIDTKKQAEKLNNFIKNTINNSPTLFIGYSGGADSFFKLVDEGFIGQHRLFWIDYVKEPNNNVKQFIDVNPNHRNFIGEQDADRFLLELAIELKCFPTELFKDPINHLKGICELVKQFPLPTSDTEVDILEDTKKTLAIVDINKPNFTIIKLAEALHTSKFDYIINQAKTLDLTLKPISKIVASAYLGKALNFLTKDDHQFQKYFDKAITLQINFYQAYAEVGIQCALTGKQDYLEKSLNYFETCFQINPKITDLKLIQGYAIVLTQIGAFKKDKHLILKAIGFYKNLLNELQGDPIFLKNYANAYKKLALLSGNESLFNEAFKFYKKSLEIIPNDVQILIDYGIAIFYLAQLNEDSNLYNHALMQLEKAKKLKSQDLNVLTNYITCLLGVAKINEDEYIFEKAKDICENVLNIEPNHVSNLENYAISLCALAELKNDINLAKKAIQYFEKTLKLKPEDQDLRYNYNEAISTLNNLDKKI